VVFNLTLQGETVIVTALMKGSSGMVETYSQTIHPGEWFNGSPYELLRDHAEINGWLEIPEKTS